MKIYGLPRTRTFRCLWLLEELGMPYELIPINFKAGDNLKPDFLKMNPYGKIPAMDDQGFFLFESMAICNYISEKDPERALTFEPGTQHKALYDQWLSFICTELEQGIWTMAKHKFALPAEKRIPEMKDVGVYEFGKALQVIKNELGSRPYLVGDKFSVADIFLAHTLGWALYFEIPLIFSNMENYLYDLKKRPAYGRVLDL